MSMQKATPSAPVANGFVIGAFVLMWVVALYPALASWVALRLSPLFAVILLVVLPLLMAAVLYPLWGRYEEEG
jgi:hypothetical protein